MASARSFDPESQGARYLARTWGPHRERWRVRILSGQFIKDGRVLGPGETMELDAPRGRQLVEQGAVVLLGRRIASTFE